MSAANQDIEDLNFIITEAIRLNKLSRLDPELYKSDFYNDIDCIVSSLKPPQDIGEIDHTLIQFNFSSAAQKVLENIAKRQYRLTEGVTVLDLETEIRNSIYIHLKNNGSFDSPGCMKLLARAQKRAKRSRKQITYFFPFNAVGLSPEKEINIGNLKIIHKDSIYAKVKEDDHYRFFIKSNEDIFNCLLHIPIPESSSNLSKHRAENVANFIYGVIRVFTTSYHYKADQIILLNHPFHKDTTHYIASSNDDYWIEGSYLFNEDLKEFWDLFEEDLKSDIGTVISKLANHASSINSKECLADRLIDAFYWFREAAKDNNENSQIIKLVTAMERLVTLSDKDITNNFCNRIACTIAVYHGDLDRWKSDLSKIYDLRSNLVHGSRSLYKSYSLPLDFNPFQLAYRTILSTCILFDKAGLELSVNESKLRYIYAELIEIGKDDKYKQKKSP